MSADDFKCFTWSGKSRRIRNGTHSFRAIASPFFYLFPFLLLIFSLLYTGLREMTFQQHGGGLSSREDEANRMGVILARNLSSLSAFSPLCPALLTSSQPWDFPQQSRPPSLRGGRRQIALLQVFAHQSLAFSSPTLVTMWKSSPANHFLAFHVFQWRDGRKPIRLYEADNHRCF